MFRKKKDEYELTRPDTYDGHGRSVQDMINEANGKPFTKNEQVALKILQDTKDRKIDWVVEGNDPKLWRAWYGNYQLFVSVRPSPSWEDLDALDKPDWVKLNNIFELYLYDGNDKIVINNYALPGCIIDELLAELNKQAPIVVKKPADILDGVLGVKL